MMKSKTCPYCGSAVELKDAFAIYRRMGFGQVYVCSTYPLCDSYVGVHEGTTKAKGSLANRELRELRQKVHAVFDPVWKDRGYDRSELYEAAAKTLGVPEFHVGELRESEARLFLSNSADLIRAMVCYVDARRKELINSSSSSSNILNALRYLFVTSQHSPVKILSCTRYRGHAETFKAAAAAGFVRKFKAKETQKQFVALTALGEAALNVRSSVTAH